ncbi:hypothetical protein NHX12_020101 [Muraenolepis orangiensis]|uniref:Uncharacterized protein n=1 Tax=Muraenolepis orangiensis TaxID=630683 RepID=A0A9Q0IUK7_9TELE|nr:hypothetical protein NHX12_020101 [Muraenolepis orangiensis]
MIHYLVVFTSIFKRQVPRAEPAYRKPTLQFSYRTEPSPVLLQDGDEGNPLLFSYRTEMKGTLSCSPTGR